MAGAGEDEAAPPPPSLDRQQPMEEAAAAAKQTRSEHHHGVADGPSFRMEDLPALQKLPTRPQGMFMHLRHMTCHLTVYSGGPNDDNQILQLAHCLDAAPQLETLHLHMLYVISSGFFSSELAGMRHHDHLRTVLMSGFRCYKAQIELAYCILGNASVLEQLIIEPRIPGTVWAGDCSKWNANLGEIIPGVCEWAQVTSERFGKVVTVVGASLHTTEASLAQQDAGSF